jgi:hypothetical protein
MLYGAISHRQPTYVCRRSAWFCSLAMNDLLRAMDRMETE